MYRLHVGSDGTGAQSGAEQLIRLGAGELRRRFRRRELSPVEVLDAVAARIELTQPLLNAFVTLCLDRARAEAEQAERRFASGDDRPLEGIPLAVKDLLDTEGVRTTYGSSIFASHVPSADAEAVRLAREAGAIVVGKTGTHEFAWGITSENPHHGPCRNPWDRDRIAGGSSGGSGVALAAGLVPLALGSDTGGSIRIPASFCGVVGLKPTYARVNAAGTFPLAPSLDHVGPMAQHPSDAWSLYRIISEIDCTRTRGGRDQGRERAPVSPSVEAPPGEARLEGVRIGVSGALGGSDASEDVEAALADCLATAADLGATMVDVEVRTAELIEDAFVTIQRAEALETHRERGLFPERSAEYGEDVRARLEQATGIGLADYLGAAADRARIDADLSAILKDVDVLVTPVSPVAPVRIGENVTLHRGREVEFRPMVLAATTPQNLAGLPACTVRAGFDSDGLPIGVQVTAAKGAEARAVAVAERLFEATPEIQDRHPELPA
jgi:aspartyl-tRNA(Asn)/glutamyl-tRNA(Gln) amidotransferase subunit A